MKKWKAKRKNKRIIEMNIIKPLRKMGVRFHTSWYESGYFIFSFEDNSVFKFKLRGLPEVLFCVWCFDNELYLFGEDVVHINKFKPSACINFTIEEIAELYHNYNKNKLSLQNVVMDVFENNYDEEYYIDENKKERISIEDFKKVYDHQYYVDRFKTKHSYFTPDEFFLVKENLRKLLTELKKNEYIENLYLEYTPQYFHDWVSIEFNYSDKCFELSDEEFDSFVGTLERKINQFNGICVGRKLCRCSTNEEIEETIKNNPNWVKVI